MIDRFVASRVIAWFLIRVLLGAVTVAVVLTLLSWWLLPADSRELYAGQYDNVRPDVRDWFNSQKSPQNGRPCCNQADGIYAEEDFREGHYWTRFQWTEGKWVLVPDEVVIRGPNRNGAPVAWFFWDNGQIRIRCFAPAGGV